MREVTQARYDRDHEVFTPLDGEAVLWRYMDLTKVLAILEDQALHFASADRLGDPFEGSLSVPMTLPPAYINDNGVIRPVSDQERQMFAQMAPSASKLTEAQRRWTYVSCWNHSEIELDALWGRYVRSDAGIAIRSSFRRLTMSFGPPLPARRERAEGPLLDEGGAPVIPVLSDESLTSTMQRPPGRPETPTGRTFISGSVSNTRMRYAQ